MGANDASEQTRQIRALRLRNQGLVPGRRDWSTPADVARGMVALQAQDLGAAKHALALRCAQVREQPDEPAVDAAFADATIVRNRPSRGTLQVTAPEDLGWLTALMSLRSNAAAVARRDQIGVTQEMVDGVGEVLRSTLGEGTVLSRKALHERFAEAGLPDGGPQASHILRHHTEMMTIVYAGPDGRSETFARPEHWIGEHRQVDGDEALAELARRFVGARGPVTVHDLAWWSNLTMADVRRAIELADEAIEAVELDATTYLVAAGDRNLDVAEVDAALADPLLLPAFDEYLLGYAARDAVLDLAHFAAIVPGRNGMFRPIVVVGGEVVGTWRQTTRAKTVEVGVEPFGRLSAATKEGLRQRADEVGAFLGKRASITCG